MLKDMARDGDKDKDDFNTVHVMISQITEAFRRLEDQLDEGQTAAGPKSIRIYIGFNEAHPLTVPFSEHSAESNYSQLRRALNHLRELPLFTFFLSTTGKISDSEFTPHRGFDASERLVHGSLNTLPPFIHLGFDQLMGSCKILETYTTLDDVTTLECIAHMGRPMYAMSCCKFKISHILLGGAHDMILATA
jgi:hypothetical protein